MDLHHLETLRLLCHHTFLHTGSRCHSSEVAGRLELRLSSPLDSTIVAHPRWRQDPKAQRYGCHTGSGRALGTKYGPTILPLATSYHLGVHYDGLLPARSQSTHQ